MQELVSSFESQFFRPFVNFLLPGLIVFLPWLGVADGAVDLAALDAVGDVGKGVLVFSAVVFLGMMVESAGSHVEAAFDGRVRERSRHESDWYDYLRLAPDQAKEPIGHHYARSRVLQLKFEINCATALASGLPALAILCFGRGFPAWLVLATLVAAILAVYLLYEARETHRLLARLRRELLHREPPAHLLPGSDGGTPPARH